MRLILALVLFGLAAWRGVIDWRATISEGHAFRPATVGALWESWAPDSHALLMPELEQSALWDPVLATFFATPLLLILMVLGLLFWLLRRRKKRERRLF